jgi:hypothetical protein
MILVPCTPAVKVAGPMRRLYCTECTSKYHAAKFIPVALVTPVAPVAPTVPVAAPPVAEDEWIHLAYDASIKKDTEILEGLMDLDKKTIIETVKKMLKEKDELIRLVRCENVCLNIMNEQMVSHANDDDYDLDELEMIAEMEKINNV